MFRATNFTVTLLLLLAFTIFMAGFRQRKPLENNWPLLYWLLVVFFTLVRPEETFNFSIILVGLACGMLLRFEFMNDFFVKTVKVVEMLVWLYILWRGFEMIIL
ncbi:MAG: hypothetical protein HYZ57_00930 [Acidobacteria bacterium]|nr:hypothetical protein [Acidobacteriota bacterium]MBI3278386.1 hypothetical protein [Acidobacteriota bacterium]